MSEIMCYRFNHSDHQRRRMAAPSLCIGMAMWLLSQAASGAIDKITSSTPATLLMPAQPVPVAALLDVGIVAFDDGLDLTSEDDTVFPEVRLAETIYFSSQLLRVLEKSGGWGAVRVIPTDAVVVDVYLLGVIVQSDGETLEIEVTARDSSNQVWFTRRYKTTVGTYAYDRRRKDNQDAFQNLFVRISNDLLGYRESLSDARAIAIRQLAELRFAQQFSPDAFNEYTEDNSDGTRRLARLPANTDPLLMRVRKIRERDYLYIDRMQEYYDGFAKQMHGPYQEFRRASFTSVVKSRQLKKQGQQRIVAGIGTIIAGIYGRLESDSGAGRLASSTTAGAGGLLVKSGLEQKQKAASLDESVSEMGSSLESTLAPQVIELEDRTVTLTGNVQAQYDQWQNLLAQIYRQERTLPNNE